MSKWLIVAPNLGTNLGNGGGAKVAVTIAQYLLTGGHRVLLASLISRSLKSLDFFSGTNLASYGNKISVSSLFRQSDKTSSATGSVRPPLAFVAPLAARYLTRVMTKFAPDAVCFNDDFPSYAEKGRFILYSHFSYATRIVCRVNEQWEMKTDPYNGRLSILLNPLLLKYTSAPPAANCIVLANGTVTAKYLRKAWGDIEVEVVPPPVHLPESCSTSEKQNLILSVGMLRPNKRFGDVLTALAHVDLDYHYMIVGFSHDKAYLAFLRHRIDKLGLGERVSILLDVPNSTLRQLLTRAKVYVHAARFEPFGISVVEAMAAGCVPIVFRGNDSGPWQDIVDKGRFGLGFAREEELTKQICRVLVDEVDSSKLDCESRARLYSPSRFTESFKVAVSKAGG